MVVEVNGAVTLVKVGPLFRVAELSVYVIGLDGWAHAAVCSIGEQLTYIPVLELNRHGRKPRTLAAQSSTLSTR
jgi:hypothetical protein